ncbi:hypothetical protein, partial [Massilia sp. DWR3-1-1]|uniref:hypothetical protein n=1 Tax=Massilia sp. DWR3-1-1 TaxID=2804559 RepID=UPI003CF32096
RYYADDSAATSVKVGYRQASYSEKTPYSDVRGFFTSGAFAVAPPQNDKLRQSNAANQDVP